MAAVGATTMDDLYAKTQLTDPKIRLAWLDKTPAEFEASDDPFIKLGIALYENDIKSTAAARERQGKLQVARSVYNEAPHRL